MTECTYRFIPSEDCTRFVVLRHFDEGDTWLVLFSLPCYLLVPGHHLAAESAVIMIQNYAPFPFGKLRTDIDVAKEGQSLSDPGLRFQSHNSPIPDNISLFG